MPRKNTRNTKGRIISAAWKLFYEQGYEATTVEDIVFESETSKGSFYHYFEGKDALLGTLANVFDEKYEQLMEIMDPEMDAMEKLVIDLKQRGYSLYVLSNVSERYWNLKKRIPVLALFKNQVLSYAEKVNKPDQKIYEVLLNRYQLNPEECLFIDDKMENLAVPQKMGWTVHQYKTAEECRQFFREMNIL